MGVVKLFLHLIKSDSDLGHFIGHIDLTVLLCSVLSAIPVYFSTDFREFECLPREERFNGMRKVSQVDWDI